MRATILIAYRVMSYVTGVLLVILVFVGLPLKYVFDSPDVVAVVGTAHGFLFMVYVVLVLALGFIAALVDRQDRRSRARGHHPVRRLLRRAARRADRARRPRRPRRASDCRWHGRCPGRDVPGLSPVR